MELAGFDNLVPFDIFSRMLFDFVFADFVGSHNVSMTPTTLSTSSPDCTSSMCLAPHKPPDGGDVYWVSATSATQRSNLRMDKRRFLALRRKLENLVLLVGGKLWHEDSCQANRAPEITKNWNKLGSWRYATSFHNLSAT